MNNNNDRTQMIPKSLLDNKVDEHIQTSTLQYITFREIIKNYKIKKHDNTHNVLPPCFKEIIENYN